MDSIRSLFGIPTSGAGNNNNNNNNNTNAIRVRAEARQKGVPVHEQWQQQVNASEMKLKVNSARIQKAEYDKANAVNRSAFETASRELLTAQTETKAIVLKLNNQRAQLKLHQDAESNIDMAITMRAGADELSSATAVMEGLQVEDTMETLREAADQVGEHSRILSAPIVVAPTQPHTLDVDDEWQQLLAQRQQQQQQQQQPVTIVPATTASVAAIAVKPRVVEKEMK
jgi:hypothetical protein